jgi:hypothetical protein
MTIRLGSKLGAFVNKFLAQKSPGISKNWGCSASTSQSEM